MEGELTQAEVEGRYSAKISVALTAFATDPQYTVDMMEHARLIEYKRELWRDKMANTVDHA